MAEERQERATASCEDTMAGPIGPKLAEYYDAVINWEKRLAREMPLVEELARAAGPRLLVPACGTGGHVVALAARGFQVLGFDADEDALEIARRKLVQAAPAIVSGGGEARIIQLKMEQAHQLGEVHDAAFCLGNALPGLSEPGQLISALRAIAGALRPGGLFFTQNLNFDRRWNEKLPWFPLLSGETREEEILLVKFAAYGTELIDFHVMYLFRRKPDGPWQSYVRTAKWIPLVRERLAGFLNEAGFGQLRFWGDYHRSASNPDESNDLIVAGEKL